MNENQVEKFLILAANILAKRPVGMTVRECAIAFGYQEKDAGNTYRLLHCLRDRGLVGWIPRKPRTLDLTPKGEEFYKRWRTQ